VASAPGNPGTAALGPLPRRRPDRPGRRRRPGRALDVDLVVVGPEAPLVAGVVDELTAAGSPRSARPPPPHRGLQGVREGDHGRGRRPDRRVRRHRDRDEAHAALERFGAPYVVKADGLAAGKGVRICADLAEAREAVDDALVRGVFGDAGTRW
jgi:phosphoribosylamine---glycine ligase